MPQYHCTATVDNTGWRFELMRQQGLFFTKKDLVPLSEWSAVAHSGVALLLSLLNSEDAQSDGDALRLTHRVVADLSRIETTRLGLPPIAPLTLFLSHTVPISDANFSLRVEWFQRSGAALFNPQRCGTALLIGTQQFLVLNPLHSVLEAISAVNNASGDVAPAGFERRMVAYAIFKQQLAQLTGDLRADDYLRGLTIHHATGLGIDLAPSQDAAPFLPILYGNQTVDAATAANEDCEPNREPLLPQQLAIRFQERFLNQGARRHFTLGNGVYTILDAPVAAALTVVARVSNSFQ
jgi:hypothetical protein